VHTLPVRTSTELDAMRAAGAVVARTLDAVQAAAVPGTADAGHRAGTARRHRLRAGSTLAIEPTLHGGSRTSGYRPKKDGWSIVTTEGKRAAHFEHTVAVSNEGPQVLTAP
jgi:methionine aminopeptidase